MTTRKSLPLVLILLLCSSLLPIYANSAQPISIPISDNPNFSCYRDAASITARIQFLTETYPNISKKVSIGESFEGASIYALEIGNEGNLNKPHFILLSGLHGNDFSQPEIALQFAEILLGGYETNADLQWIVDNVEVDLILLANPDGRIMAEEEAKTAHEPEDVDYLTNKNNVDLEKNYCFKIEGSSEGCSTFTFQPETQAVINYLNSKLGSPIPNQPPQYDSQNLFIYFSSHNKETPASSIVSNYQGKLRIPKFYTPNPSPLTDLGLLHLKELTEMLRIFGTDPKSYIETFKTEGLPFSQYPVDYAYFSHGVASIELSAPPKDDSKPMACYLFTSEHIQNYIDLFVKAAKSAVRPFKIGYGPIVDGMAQTEFTETEITFHATISEKNQIPDQPEHNAITSIHYYIDQPIRLSARF